MGLTPSVSSGLVEITTDPDKNGIFKISDKNQKITIVATDSTHTTTQYYDLSGVTFDR